MTSTFYLSFFLMCQVYTIFQIQQLSITLIPFFSLIPLPLLAVCNFGLMAAFFPTMHIVLFKFLSQTLHLKISPLLNLVTAFWSEGRALFKFAVFASEKH